MSKENAKKFFDELVKNKKLQKDFEAMLGVCSKEAEKMFSAKTTEFIKKSGFECTAADFNKLIEGDELSDKELEKASGGAFFPFNPWRKQWHREDEKLPRRK